MHPLIRSPELTGNRVRPRPTRDVVVEEQIVRALAVAFGIELARRDAVAVGAVRSLAERAERLGGEDRVGHARHRADAAVVVIPVHAVTRFVWIIGLALDGADENL